MKRVRVAIVVVLVILAGVIGWRMVGPSESEPVYKGRTLTRWLRDSADSFTVTDVLGLSSWQGYCLTSPLGTNASAGANMAAAQARSALLGLGTNAIPGLLRLLRAEDSTLRTKFMSLEQRQHLVKIRLVTSEFWHYAAAWGFQALGESAQNAVPGLIDVAKAKVSPSSRKFAIMSLGFIGPAAKAAVPTLVLWLHDADSEVRTWAGVSLRKIDREAAQAAGAIKASPP